MYRNSLLNIAKQSYEVLPDCDIFQFGVYSGQSMEIIAEFYASNGIKVNNFLGYDVFTGFPADPEEPAWQDCWSDGHFDGTLLWKMQPEKICVHLEQKIRNIFLKYNQDCNVKIFAGLVEDTLNDENLSKLNLTQCSYVDCDFDIYTPTKFALDYLVKKNLIKSGTIVNYDDWGGSPHFNYEHGESRAHKEVFMDNNIDTKLIFETGNPKDWCIKNNPHIQKGYILL